MRFKSPFTLSIVFALAASSLAGHLEAASPNAAIIETETPANLALGAESANVYVQTSAEYRACCYGIYAAAGRRLEEILEDADPPPARPAVVMDLDETVLDNSTFQTFLYVNGLEYSEELWDAFERGGAEEVGLVPGAAEFIQDAEARGVAVIYLSNRNGRNREWTVRAIEHAGLDTTGIAGRLYLREDGASSNKAGRRDAVSAEYNVLMLFGDNLRDFSEVFKPRAVPAEGAPEAYGDAIADRARAVDDAACHWGVDWFVLPNPMYGEWEKLEGPNPADVLHPSGMPRPE